MMREEFMRVIILLVIAVLVIPATGMAQGRRANPNPPAGIAVGALPQSDPHPPAGIAVGALPWGGYPHPPAGIAVPAPLPRSASARPPRHEVPRQTISPRSGPASEGWPRDSHPTWSNDPRHRRQIPGVPHPQIGLPLAPIGLQPHAQWNRGARHYRDRSYAPWYAWPVVYAVPQVVDAYPQMAPVTQPVVAEPIPETGRLILDVQPRIAQVFVDGYYAGTPDDFSADRGGLLLEAGPHRIDLILPDYERVTFDVRIAPNQFITYRQVLKPVKVEPVVPAPAARSAPSTFYLIPGCYMGNVPPKEVKLQPSCDPARVITFQQ
jgi:hypothetical protein